MKTKITKEVFLQFLKDNDFYDEWLEAWNIDDEIYQEEIPIDHFFENSSIKAGWFWSGIGELVFIPSEEERKHYPSELIERWLNWRKQNLSKCMELDDKWINFVNQNK